MNRRLYPALTFSLITLAACEDVRRSSSHGPIRLGDPATIVTETDSAYLRSADSDPATDAPPAVASTASPADTTPAPVPAATAATTPAGYTVDFGDVKVTLTGATVRERGKSFAGASSAALSAAGTSYSGNGIAVAGGTASKVQERKSLGVVAVRDGKRLLLEDLGTTNTAWTTLKSSGGAYAGTSTAAGSFPKLNAASVRSAVDKAARKQKLSAKDIQAWQAAVRGQSSVGTSASSSLQTALRSVTYKIEGKTAAGKAFSKEVRVDVPL